MSTVGGSVRSRAKVRQNHNGWYLMDVEESLHLVGWRKTCQNLINFSPAFSGVMIPTEVGHGFRFEAGYCSGMKPASIPE